MNGKMLGRIAQPPQRNDIHGIDQEKGYGQNCPHHKQNGVEQIEIILQPFGNISACKCLVFHRRRHQTIADQRKDECVRQIVGRRENAQIENYQFFSKCQANSVSHNDQPFFVSNL